MVMEWWFSLLAASFTVSAVWEDYSCPAAPAARRCSPQSLGRRPEFDVAPHASCTPPPPPSHAASVSHSSCSKPIPPPSSPYPPTPLRPPVLSHLKVLTPKTAPNTPHIIPQRPPSPIMTVGCGPADPNVHMVRGGVRVRVRATILQIAACKPNKGNFFIAPECHVACVACTQNGVILFYNGQ